MEDKLRDDISDQSDTYLDTTVPTIDYDYAKDRYSPRYSFIDSTSFPAPEFYTEYPVFVSEGSSKVDQYGSIYKLVTIENPEDTTSIDISVFGADSGLQVDIVSLDVYVIWKEITNSGEEDETYSVEYAFADSLTADEFTVDMETGVITILSGPIVNNDAFAEDNLLLSAGNGILKSLLSKIAEISKDTSDKEYIGPKLLFQIKVEKYRSITDTRDLTEDQVNTIATAQAIEAAILEYNYQFNLATQTQLGFSEMIYTVVVTAISTALTMVAVAGIGQAVKALSPATVVKGSFTKKFVERIGGSFVLGEIAGSIVKESLQEVFLDPWIEAAVSGVVRRAGYNAYWQATLSTLAESGREALTGIFNSQRSIKDLSLIEVLDQQYYEKGLTPTLQDVIETMKEITGDIEAQQVLEIEVVESRRSAAKAISFVAKAAGFATAMFLGPVAALTYTTLTSYLSTGADTIKSVFKKMFNPVKIAISKSKVADYVRNNKKKVLGLIGIGVLGTTMWGLQVLIPALSGLASFGSLGLGLGGISIGMVDIKQKKSPNNDLDAETRELIDWYDSLPIDQRYQYSKKLPFGDKVINMDPTQFKTSYKGPYSQYFRYVKDPHNRYLGVKTVGKLLKIMKNMDYKGIVYKITQVYDDHGNRLKSGGIFITYGKVRQKGPIRIGSAQILQERLKQYQYKSKRRPGNNFEQALGTHPMGIKAFRIEILSVCKTQKELLATEAFWTLYSNRISFGRGFDLSENDFFNPIIGGFTKGFQAYNIPRWELVKLVMQNKQKKEMQQYYTNKYSTTSQINLETINLRFDQFFGTHKLQEIKLMILKPLLEKCFKRGFDANDALVYLKGSGIEWYSGPVNIRKQLSALIDDAVEIFGDLRSGIRSDRWNAIRTLLFTEPYVEFLKSQGVVDRPPAPPAGRGIGGTNTLDEITDYSIIEYLLAKNIPPTEIAIQIGICQADDPKPVKSLARKMVYSYLTFKYENAFKEAGMSYNIENLRKFLKSHFIGDDLYW